MAENDWLITKPIDHTKIGEIPQKIRDVKSSAKIILSKEHVTPATDNAGGQHLKGSARVYLQSGLPSLDPEGNSLDTSATSDNGRLMVDTAQSNELRVYVASIAGITTGCEHIRVARVKASENLDANSYNIVNIASGTVTGQALHVGQIDTTYLILNEPSTGAALRVHINTSFIATDHDAGLTVRAVSLNSSVMTSAVVLNNVASQIATLLSAYTNEDSESNAMLKSHAYLAATAGYVKVLGTPNATNQYVRGYVGTTNDPAGAGDYLDAAESSINVLAVGIGLFVAKGEYFEIRSTMGSSLAIYWKSFGTISKPVDQD